ncbi:MAG: helix-turn-helix transcriptional regulator [Clostridia bacterium]|nr:helix-turn-helix transcriptional regulator [Clostridia bacterium]
MVELTKLSKNLKDLRKQYGYTQSHVAESIGVSCSSYQAYEWGVAVPTLQHFVKLANLYSVTCDDLLE